MRLANSSISPSELAPRSGKKITHHAAQMPKKVPWIPPALPARKMHDRGLGHKPDVVPAEPEAGAEVDVFIVQMIVNVKSADRRKCVLSEQHEHAGYPVRRNAFVADFVISLRPDSYCFAEEAQGRRKG